MAERRVAAEKGGPVEPVVAADGPFRSGYVALVGRPNVGKSTLLNALLGQKLVATTHKPQTTRRNFLGVLHPQGAQILLLDTPGHHRAKGPLNRFMVAEAEQAIAEAEVVGLVVEARTDDLVTPGNARLAERVLASRKPVVLLSNKVDRVRDRRALLGHLGAYVERLGERLAAAVPVSATRREGLETAVLELGRALPVGPRIFDETLLTDQPERAIVSEFIREKVMLATKDELPYAAAVSLDAFEDQRPKLVRLVATVHVERASQKPIVIGRGGHKIRDIGSAARKDIEFLLGSKVFIDLHVRVTDDWASNPRRFAEFGYVHAFGGAAR